MLTQAKTERVYLSVLADGKLHTKAPEGAEGSVKRKYTSSDGKEGIANEFVYNDVTGMITDIAFVEGKFGNQFQIEISDGDEKPVVLTLGTASNYGEDAMKKILSVDMTKPVKIAPYSFQDEKGKSKKGITIYQGDIKIPNYFYDAEAKANIHGYPEPKKLKKPLTKDQWKLYFGECREFLVTTITEHFKLDEKVDSRLDDYGNKAME